MAVPKPLSPRRDEIFRPPDKPRFLLNDERWPDFYALLETPPHASTRELEDAIIEATSQLFAANFARGMTPRLRLVERFTPDFRLILLDPERRARYDALLERHLSGEKPRRPTPISSRANGANPCFNWPAAKRAQSAKDWWRRGWKRPIFKRCAVFFSSFFRSL